MMFALGGDGVIDNIVVGCRAGTAGGAFFDGDPGNDPALLLSGVTATLVDLEVGVEVHGPLSVGVLTASGDFAGLSSGGLVHNDSVRVVRSRLGGFLRVNCFWRMGGGSRGRGGASLAITLILISLACNACLNISCAL